MFRKIFILFRIARRLAISDAVEIISKIHQPPIIIKTLLNIVSFSFSKKMIPKINLMKINYVNLSRVWEQLSLNWVNF